MRKNRIDSRDHRLAVVLLLFLCTGFVGGAAFSEGRLPIFYDEGDNTWLNSMDFYYYVALNLTHKSSYTHSPGRTRAVVIDPEGVKHYSSYKTLKAKPTKNASLGFRFPGDFKDSSGKYSWADKRGYYSFYFEVDGEKVFDNPKKSRFYIKPYAKKSHTGRDFKGVLFRDAR